MKQTIKRVAQRYASQTGPLPTDPHPDWDTIKAWKRKARNTPPTPFGRSRASEISNCQRGVMGGKALETCMTMGEYRFLMDTWDSMPGNTSQVDALNQIKKGRPLSPTDIQRKVVLAAATERELQGLPTGTVKSKDTSKKL